MLLAHFEGLLQRVVYLCHEGFDLLALLAQHDLQMPQQQLLATFSALRQHLLYIAELYSRIIDQLVNNLLLVDPRRPQHPQQPDSLILVHAQQRQQVLYKLLGELCVLVEVVLEVAEDFYPDAPVRHLEVGLEDRGVLAQLMVDVALCLCQVLAEGTEHQQLQNGAEFLFLLIGQQTLDFPYGLGVFLDLLTQIETLLGDGPG